MAQRTEPVPQAADLVDRNDAEDVTAAGPGWQRILPAVFLAAIVGLWELASRFTDVPVYILPAPSAIVERLVRSWPLLWEHSIVTLTEIGIGFAVGVALGLALAIPIAYSTIFRNTIYPLIVASQAVPKIAIAPLMVLWLGFDIMPKIVVTALMVFFPVTVTAAEGFSSVDRNLLDLLRSVHASPAQIFFKIRFPHALPQIFSGLKIGITLAVVGAVVGEWVGADSGLGYLLVYANTLLDSTLLFASLILLIAIGVVLFVIVGVLERLLLPWHRDDSTFITA